MIYGTPPMISHIEFTAFNQYLSEEFYTCLDQLCLMFPNLDHFYIHNDEITSLPPSIISLHHLKILHIHAASLCSLPETFFASFPELEDLELHRTKIPIFPPSFFQLKHLTRLVLSNSPSLPFEIEDFLETFSISITEGDIKHEIWRAFNLLEIQKRVK